MIIEYLNEPSDTPKPYVYHCMWTEHNKQYIGVRSGNVRIDCRAENDIMQRYKTSSDHVKKFIEDNGMPDHVWILNEFECREDADQSELFLLKTYGAVKDTSFLNRNDSPSLPIKIGKDNYFYGKRLTGPDNPNYGKTHTEETRSIISKKNSKPVTIDGVTYPSVGKAGDSLELSYHALRYRLHTSKLYYTETSPRVFKSKSQPGRIGHIKPVTIDDIWYESIVKASRELGLTYNILFLRLHTSKSYYTETSPRVFESKPQTVEKGSVKPVTIDDVWYPSVAKACKMLGLTYATLISRLHISKSYYTETSPRNYKTKEPNK